MGYHDSDHRFGSSLKSFFNACALGLALIFSATGTARAAELYVPVNESKIFVLDQSVSTVAVTNPAIADVSVHNDKIIMVIGRTFGTTNVIALDADGHPVATKRIRVVSVAGSGNVTYVRGPDIFSYSCAPRCERISLPDQGTAQAASK